MSSSHFSMSGLKLFPTRIISSCSVFIACRYLILKKKRQFSIISMIVNICRFIIVNYSQTDRQNKLTCSFIIKELHHIFKCSFLIFFIMKLSSECDVVLNRSDFLLFFSLFSFFIDTMYEQSLMLWPCHWHQ